MMFERKLNSNRRAQKELNNRLCGLQHPLSHLDLHSDMLIHTMSSIYVDIISPLGLHIQVAGIPIVLQNTKTQDKVRAILLAGIRSAVLWATSRPPKTTVNVQAQLLI